MTVVSSDSGATFSDCGLYRYLLWRRWNGQLPVVNFLMLNPSTATDVVSDPTVTRCIKRAKSWGYGGVIVTNIFALRSTDPQGLRQVDDPVGPRNDQAIYDAASEAHIVICAWGEHGLYRGRATDVWGIIAAPERLGKKLRCLRRNKSGQPAHPLYLPYHLRPTPFH